MANDPCECIWYYNHLAMQRLLSILRETQTSCTDIECFSTERLPGPLEAPPSSNFFMTCLIIAFAVLMFVLRPNSLRQSRNDSTKGRDNGHGSSGDPPGPPSPAY